MELFKKNLQNLVKFWVEIRLFLWLTRIFIELFCSAKHVIHTVGPFGEKPDLLKDAYTNSLKVLVENDLKTIAFPCISTGVYHYPNEAAAHVAITAVKDALLKHSLIEKVIFCVFLEKDFEIYSKLLEEYFPKNGDKNEL